MLRRISLSGLKGRPRQTIILLTTMVLAVFFVTIAMNLLSTSQVNRAIQRRETFGEWSNVFIADDLSRAEDLKAQDLSFASNRIIGRDARIGIIAAADENFWQSANIHVIEGRLPEALDEIVLTESQVSYFAEKPHLGQRITVSFEVASSDHEGYLFDSGVAALVEKELDETNRYIAENWQGYQELIRQAQVDWLENQTIYTQRYLDTLATSRIAIDRLEAAESYVDQVNGEFERKLALFANLPVDVEDGINRLEQFQLTELPILVEDILSSPVALLYGDEDTSIEVLRQNIRQEHSREGLLQQFLRYNTMPRNSSELEAFSGTIVSSRTRSSVVRYGFQHLFSHLYHHLPKDRPETLSEELILPLSGEIVIHRDLVVTGIIENYHQVWDGPFTQYATGFVSPETGERLIEGGLYQSKIEANRLFQTPFHFFVITEDPKIVAASFPSTTNLYDNNLGFGQDTGLNEDSLSMILLAVITLVTAFSIFQISLIQFKKRLRKLALLRAIGATFKQLRRILSWEALYLITLAFPIGIALGFIISFILIWLNNLITGDNLVLRLNWTWLSLGYGLTFISILIGLFIPMLRISGVPLRGKMAVTDKSATKSTRELLGELKLQRQTLTSINRRHHRFIRKQQLIHLALMSSIIFILLGSYLLIYLAFGDYREKTVHANMPDFELEAPFQQGLRVSREFMSQLEDIPGVTSTELFVRGIKAYLWFDGIGQTPLDETFRQLIPEEMYREHFGTVEDFLVPEEDEYKIKQAAVTDIYGIVADSELEKAMVNMLPADFDLESFRINQQAILLLPSYYLNENTQIEPIDPAKLESIGRQSRMKQVLELAGAGSITYDIRRAPVLDHAPGSESIDEVTLTIPLGATAGESNRRLNHVRQYTVPITQVIYHLPEEGFWPLSDSIQNPILFFSQYNMDSLYPYKMHRMLSFDLIYRYKGDESAIRFGSSIVQVTESNITPENATELKRLGFTNGYQVKSLYLQKQQLYSKGLRTSLIIGLLAATLLLIAIQIQSGSFRGQIEVERERIGILQSLGVTEKAFRQSYLKEAIIRVLQSIALAHIIIVLGLILYLLVEGQSNHLLTELKMTLWDYNWLWHGGIVLFFAVLGTLATFLPVGRTLKRRPVENIRSLN